MPRPTSLPQPRLSDDSLRLRCPWPPLTMRRASLLRTSAVPSPKVEPVGTAFPRFRLDNTDAFRVAKRKASMTPSRATALAGRIEVRPAAAPILPRRRTRCVDRHEGQRPTRWTSPKENTTGSSELSVANVRQLCHDVITLLLCCDTGSEQS